MTEDNNFREIAVDRDMQIKMIKDSLALPYGATYEVFVSDFKEFYTKEQVMYEYTLIKDLEPEYHNNHKYQQWKQALIDVINWHNGARLT